MWTLISVIVYICGFCNLCSAILEESETNLQERNLGKIVFASIFYRHGDRAPALSYPRDPYNLRELFPAGYGQLTATGMQQHYELGRYFRRRYGDLLPAEYNVNDIYVRSSDVDRALQSAAWNLQGLYPAVAGGRLQLVPVHSAPSDQDKILAVLPSCNKFYSDLYRLDQTATIQCITAKAESITSYVNKYTGLPGFASVVYDILYIEELLNLTLPKWTTAVYPEKLRYLALFNQFYITSLTRDLIKYTIGPVISEMVSNMVEKRDKSLYPDRKIFMYSGHDLQLFNLLRGFRIDNGQLVPYAAAILVELRQTENNEYAVTVFYKNSSSEEPYLMTLPGCDSLCPLDTFIELTKDVIPKYFQVECLSTGGYLDTNFQTPFLGLPGDWQDCFS